MKASVSKAPAWLLLLCLGPVCLGVAGCGQKGPLYLPKEQPEQGTAKPLQQGEGSKASAPAAEPAQQDAR